MRSQMTEQSKRVQKKVNYDFRENDVTIWYLNIDSHLQLFWGEYSKPLF